MTVLQHVQMSLCWDHQSYTYMKPKPKKSKEKYQFRIEEQSRHAIEKQKVQTWDLNYMDILYIHTESEDTCKHVSLRLYRIYTQSHSATKWHSL